MIIRIDDRDWDELTEEEKAEKLKGIPPLPPEREKALIEGLIKYAKEQGWELNKQK